MFPRTTKQLARPGETLASIETLTLEHGGDVSEWISWLEQLPRLRAVFWPLAPSNWPKCH